MSLTGFQRRRRELAAKQAAEEAAQKAAENKSIDEMTVAELQQYAADNMIDLGGAKKKADILAVIIAHESGASDSESDQDDMDEGAGVQTNESGRQESEPAEQDDQSDGDGQVEQKGDDIDQDGEAADQNEGGDGDGTEE